MLQADAAMTGHRQIQLARWIVLMHYPVRLREAASKILGEDFLSEFGINCHLQLFQNYATDYASCPKLCYKHASFFFMLEIMHEHKNCTKLA